MFNDMFAFPAKNFKRMETPVMKTDVKEVGDNYQLDIELPGYNKEDLSVELHEGNLTIKAVKEETQEEKDDKDNYVRRERYTGSCQRSFYVGKKIEQEDIKAVFTNGVLTLTVPKQAKKAEPEKTMISIEG